jgi:hypothetical protein
MPDPAPNLEEAIKTNAAGPKQASADGVTVQQHSLADQIAADKHLASKQAMRSKGLGLKLVKIAPGGTV